MTMTRKNRQKNAAVSPVVGVLLMLVVTLIIAAVVSGFAGGLTRSTDKTPQVALDVSFVLSPTGGELTIKHLGGDPINTKNTHIITSWVNQTGEVNYARTGPVLQAECATKCNSAELICVICVFPAGPGTVGAYQEPVLVLPEIVASASTPEVWWGNFVLNPGDLARAKTSLSNSNMAVGEPFIKNYAYLQKGDIITFKMVDMVSGGTIYEKNVRVV